MSTRNAGRRWSCDDMGLSLLVLLLELIGVCDVFALRGMKILVPTAVRAGATVTLECDYDLENAALYSIRWYHGDEEFYRFVPKESPPSKIFPTMPAYNVDMSESDNRQVTLRDIQRELTGYYKCEVSADAPLFHTDIRSAHMTVVEIPSEGPTLITDLRKIALGAKLKANCTTPMSPNTINLTWYINGEQVQPSPNIKISKYIRRYPGYPLYQSSVTNISMDIVQSLFKHGKMRLRCLATMFTLYRRTDEIEILEDTPKVAMVMRPTETSSVQVYDGYSHGSTISKLSIIHFYIFMLTMKLL